MVLGLRIREAAFALGAILVLVTYGHLLSEPMFPFSNHIFPRLALLLVVLLTPAHWDAWNLDWYLGRSKKESAPEGV